MQSNLFQDLQGLMVSRRFVPSRDYSQNFMVDGELIERIVSCARLKKTDVVLEIGPGVGFLTQELVKKCRVVAVEADHKMASILRDRVKSANLEIIEGDFLSISLPSFNKVVSLPPYSISTQIMNRLLFTDFGEAHLVFQKEFVEKLVAEPGFPDYSMISAATQYFCDAKVIIDRVMPDSFYPKPKSFSSLIGLKCRKRFGEAINEPIFIDFLSAIFRYRNKNLANAISNAVPFLKKNLPCSEDEFSERVSSLRLAREKVCLIGVRDYVKIFNVLFGNQHSLV